MPETVYTMVTREQEPTEPPEHEASDQPVPYTASPRPYATSSVP